MTREDIAYINSWGESFGKCSWAKVLKALTEGIWICSNKDPEDIYRVMPKLIQMRQGGPDLHFYQCPFEFSFEDGETYEWSKDTGRPEHKGRHIKHYNATWALDCYEMRKIVSKLGRLYAKKHKIAKKDILDLVVKNGYDDEKSYREYMATRPDLQPDPTKGKYLDFTQDDFRYVRAAFAPHIDPLYNWTDHPELCGLEDPEDCD